MKQAVTVVGVMNGSHSSVNISTISHAADTMSWTEKLLTATELFPLSHISSSCKVKYMFDNYLILTIFSILVLVLSMDKQQELFLYKILSL